MNSAVLEYLTKSNSPALFALVIGVVAIMFVREYLRAMIALRQLKMKPSTAASELREGPQATEADAESSAAVVTFNFRLLERYYEQHLIEYRVMSRASLVIASLGFVVIIIGVFLAFGDRVAVGVVSSLAGLISEAASLLFFRQNKVLIDQVQDFHKKLVSTQYLLTSIALTRDLPLASATAQRERIIGNLLFLSNELHGAESRHLFTCEEGQA